MSDQQNTDVTATGDTPASDASTTAAAATTDSTTATAPIAGEGQGDADTTAETPAKQQSAPEAYEAFTLPEGVTLNGERLVATHALFKDANLSQAQAQQLVDGFVKFRGEDAPALDAMLEQRHAAIVEEWREQSKAEFAGKFDDLKKDARAGAAHMEKAQPGTLAAFDTLGWGNHPRALAAFAEIGRLIGGSSMQGLGGETAGDAAPKTPAERMFGPKP